MNKDNIGFISDPASNEDERQTHMEILSLQQWMIWGAVVIILAGLFIWGIFGYIIERSTGIGLILPSTLQIAVAQSRMEGNVEKVYVGIGDRVEKGQVLALVSSVVEDEEIQETKYYLNALKEQQKNYMDEIANQRLILKRQTEKLTKTYNTEELSLKEHKTFMDDFIVKAKNLSNKGSISIIRYRSYRNELHKLDTDLAALNSKRVTNSFDQSRYSYSWIQDIYRIKLMVLEVTNKLLILQKKKEARSKITAPISGTITKVFKDIGDLVTRGTTFAGMVNDDDGASVECLTLVPVKDGKRIKKGMEAYISPTVAQKEIYGTIEGTVETIYNYPMSTEDVANILNDGAMAKLLTQGGPSVAIRIKMLKDKSTVTGYKWTSNTGPDFTITTGTMCMVDVDVKKRRPITLIIPYLREFIGYRY